MKLNRIYNITIDDKKGNKFEIAYPLKCIFNVQKFRAMRLNMAKIQIYNLKKESSNFIHQDRYNIFQYKQITLNAGYESSGMSVIFKGNIIEAYTEKSGTDRITHITAQDGQFSTANAYANVTLGAGSTLQDVIKESVKQLGLPTGKIGDVSSATLPRGYNMSGNVYNNLKNTLNGEVFIDDEKFYKLSANEVMKTGGTIPLIASDSGLLKTPRRQGFYLFVESLFEPSVKIGSIIEVNSNQEVVFNGQYSVAGITHSGEISGSSAGSCTTSFELFTPPGKIFKYVL